MSMKLRTIRGIKLNIRRGVLHQRLDILMRLWCMELACMFLQDMMDCIGMIFIGLTFHRGRGMQSQILSVSMIIGPSPGIEHLQLL